MLFTFSLLTVGLDCKEITLRCIGVWNFENGSLRLAVHNRHHVTALTSGVDTCNSRVTTVVPSPTTRKSKPLLFLTTLSFLFLRQETRLSRI
jgi:hypothetical protein